MIRLITMEVTGRLIAISDNEAMIIS